MLSKLNQCLHRSSALIAAMAIAVLWMQTRFDEAPDVAAIEHLNEQLTSRRCGTIAPLDGGRFHLEAIITHRGVFRILILGSDVTEVVETARQTPIAYVIGKTGKTIHIPLRAEQQTGDRPGRTSQFLAKLPHDLRNQRLSIAISNLRIGGREARARLDWLDIAERSETLPAESLD